MVLETFLFVQASLRRPFRLLIIDCSSRINASMIKHRSSIGLGIATPMPKTIPVHRTQIWDHPHTKKFPNHKYTSETSTLANPNYPPAPLVGATKLRGTMCNPVSRDQQRPTSANGCQRAPRVPTGANGPCLPNGCQLVPTSANGRQRAQARVATQGVDDHT